MLVAESMQTHPYPIGPPETQRIRDQAITLGEWNAKSVWHQYRVFRAWLGGYFLVSIILILNSYAWEVVMGTY